MKMFATFARALVVLSFLAGATAQATVITAADPTQLGRLSRNSIPQDWSSFESYPGAINATTVYNYRTFKYNVGVNNFVELFIDSVSPNLFVSVYQTSYDPNNKQSNWLGDAGASGNYTFDTSPTGNADARYFQIIAALNSTIVVVVNTTGAGGVGLNEFFALGLNGYRDSQYNFDAVTLVIPEPSSVLLLLAPLVLLGAGRGLKRRAARRAA